MRALAIIFLLGLLTAQAAEVAEVSALKDPSAFDGITNKVERSRALFREAGKVIQSPRCLVCHPNGDTPAQGDDLHPHYPAVVRGPHNDGVVGMKCTTCHQDHNLDLARVPGAPGWHLAPLSMAWVGKNLHSICEQIKDPKRNGNKSMDQLIEHFAHDKLVGWGWHPGNNRTPAPGTQERMGALIAAWIATGAECPPEHSKETK